MLLGYSENLVSVEAFQVLLIVNTKTIYIILAMFLLAIFLLIINIEHRGLYV